MRRGLFAITACVVLSFVIAPTAANAAWLPAADLSAPFEFGFEQDPQVAVDASGGAVAVWPQLQGGHYIIQASSKSSEGSWGSSVDLSAADWESIEPRVAMNGGGDAVAVWVNRANQDTVKAATRTPQGDWGTAENVSVPGEDSGYLDVAINSAGDAVAVWTKLQSFPSYYLIEAATRSPGGQWEPPVALSESGRNAWGPKVAIDPSGKAVVVWYRYDEEGNTVVQASETEPGATWSEPEDLSFEGSNAESPEVEARAGRAVVVWMDEGIIEGTARELGGEWQAPEEISGPESREPEVGADDEGSALAVWSSESEDGLTVESSTLPVGGAWTEATAVAGPFLVEATEPQVAVNPSGEAITLWSSWDGHERLVEAASGTSAAIGKAR